MAHEMKVFKHKCSDPKRPYKPREGPLAPTGEVLPSLLSPICLFYFFLLCHNARS